MVRYKSAAASRIDRDCYVRLLERAAFLFSFFQEMRQGLQRAQGSWALLFCGLQQNYFFGNQGIWSHDSFHSVRPDG